MNVLLLGANGQLGRSFVKNGGLSRYGEVALATRDGAGEFAFEANAADLSKPEALVQLLERSKPGLIVNAAAYTAVDLAEKEEPLATCVNGDALQVIGEWAAANDALVVHYSTDYVFDGTKREPYAVSDATAPINAYGRSKLRGEQALQASGAKYFVFRTAWVYAAHGHNFLKSMLRLGREGTELSIVNDQFGTPTSTNLIVEATLKALDYWIGAPPDVRSTLVGTYHVVSSGIATWHDFATTIFHKAVSAGLLPRAPQIKPIGTDGYPTPARRPAWSVLDNSGFSQRFGFVLPDWQIGLDEVINELYVEANEQSC